MSNELLSKNPYNFTKKQIYFGEVIENIDRNVNGKIKVRIPEIDRDNIDIPYCYPALNYQFQKIKPKIGERIMVLTESVSGGDESINSQKRYWLSITIPNQQFINKSKYFFNANSNEEDGFINQNQNIIDNKKALGTYPQDEEVGYYGRSNVDILMRSEELILRCGRHLKNNELEFNTKNSSYIQIKNSKEFVSNTDKFETVEIQNPATHRIKIIIIDNTFLIKIFDIKTDERIEKFTKSHETPALTISACKTKIKEFQKKYKKWIIDTNSPELKDIKKIYKNAIEKKKIPVKNNDIKTNPNVINIVSEKVNLISTNSNYDLHDPMKNINEETQELINNELQRMVKGDNLLNFLKLIKLYATTHVHPHHGIKAVNDEILQKISKYDLNKILSDDFRLS